MLTAATLAASAQEHAAALAAQRKSARARAISSPLPLSGSCSTARPRRYSSFRLSASSCAAKLPAYIHSTRSSFLHMGVNVLCAETAM
jgi:hypothetical protein